MRQALELSVDRLRRRWTVQDFDFTDTRNVPPLYGLLGQDRAVRALEFGLGIRAQGYNIFVAGPSGTGKTSYTRSLVMNRAALEKPASDWVYVQNFDRPDEPGALELPPGEGPAFARALEEMVTDAQTALDRTLDSKEHAERKQRNAKQAQEQLRAVVAELEQAATDRSFQLKETESGFAPIPMRGGQLLTQEAFHELSEVEQQAIKQAADELSTAIAATGKQMYELQKELQRGLRQLDSEVAAAAVQPIVERVQTQYRPLPPVVDYLERLEKDIVDNLDALRSDGRDGGAEEPAPPVLMPTRRKIDPTRRYRVNVFVTQDVKQGAPLVIETNPTYTNLFGHVEYVGSSQELHTDIAHIKSGAIHRANGGYLIIQAPDLLQNPFAWEALKRALSNRAVRIESPPEMMKLAQIETYRPEPIPLEVKVILIGTSALYHGLYGADENFRKLFKLRAEFDTVMEATPENVVGYAAFIANFCQREGICHLDAGAVGRVLEYSHRLAGDQNKLSAQFNEVVDIVYQACAWGRATGGGMVRAADVDRAFQEKMERSGLAADRSLELIERGQVMVDVDGSAVGQVNALTVMSIGDYSFGAPCRVTATVHLGQQGILHIARETQMSGQIHDKGLLTLTGFLGQRYAQRIPLSLTCSLSFEQTYVPVDGDSASSTELYAVLSALSGLPVYQGIAVTGSVNQFGQIQPIGGVNEKIEGFFRICKVKGLVGGQGVMIPQQNVNNLALSQEVVDAVVAGQFHIWSVADIDEGMEILTGVSAGPMLPDGSYPEDTVNGRVSRKIEDMARGLTTWWQKTEKKENNSAANEFTVRHTEETS